MLYPPGRGIGAADVCQSDTFRAGNRFVLTSTLLDAPTAELLEPKNRLRDFMTGWEAVGRAVAQAVFSESRTCVYDEHIFRQESANLTSDTIPGRIGPWLVYEQSFSFLEGK